VIARNKVPVERGAAVFYYINDGVYGSFNYISFDHTQSKGEPLFSDGEGKLVFPSRMWGPICGGLDQVEVG
jgi:hypothetical protein